MMINPNCSETVTRLTLKPDELELAKVIAKIRFKDLSEAEYDELITELVDSKEGEDEWISEGLAAPYLEVTNIIKTEREKLDILNKKWWVR